MHTHRHSRPASACSVLGSALCSAATPLPPLTGHRFPSVHTSLSIGSHLSPLTGVALPVVLHVAHTICSHRSLRDSPPTAHRPPPITHHPSPIPTPTPHPLHSCTLSACGRTMRTTARGVGSRRCRTGRRHVVRLCYLRAGCTSTALPSVTTAGPAHCAGMQMLCPYAMLRVLRCHWLHGWHRMGIRCQALHCLQH